MAASHLIVALLHTVAAWVAVVRDVNGGIYTFTFAYGVSFGPIGWVLPSEVFPLSMPARGVELVFIGLITPVMIEVSAATCFLAYLWATYSVPETAGIALEDMDHVFGSEVGREDAAMRREVEEELGLREILASLADRPDEE
ncbi:hypothetical protein B0H14DRAFT_2830346 [Mycena olivaceomarginata]|nr:hypothetical protein B0H14DRAFT_2830346 [Mycena olivaceomarginata]